MKRLATTLVSLLCVHHASTFSPVFNKCTYRPQNRKQSQIAVSSTSNQIPFDRDTEEDRQATNAIRIAEAEEEHRNLYEGRKEKNEDDAQVINTLIKALRTSFKNVEGMTMNLLNTQPLLALVIFIGLGLLVAYLSGFCILCGYISSPNPLENGEVPYWEAEVTNDLLDVIAQKASL